MSEKWLQGGQHSLATIETMAQLKAVRGARMLLATWYTPKQQSRKAAFLCLFLRMQSKPIIFSAFK